MIDHIWIEWENKKQLYNTIMIDSADWSDDGHGSESNPHGNVSMEFGFFAKAFTIYYTELDIHDSVV